MEVTKIKTWLTNESDYLNDILKSDLNNDIKLQLQDVLEGINNILLYLEEGHSYCHSSPFD